MAEGGADRISQQIFGCETALSFLFLFPRTEVGITSLEPTTWKMQDARQWRIRPPSSRRRADLDSSLRRLPAV